ncbi:hypothetical protein C8R43DRAFT_952023 [Mycena crocata]|nr:hypothetical protein C8R43DRAFT_952023 [Mycena crocata]
MYQMLKLDVPVKCAMIMMRSMDLEARMITLLEAASGVMLIRGGICEYLWSMDLDELQQKIFFPFVCDPKTTLFWAAFRENYIIIENKVASPDGRVAAIRQRELQVTLIVRRVRDGERQEMIVFGYRLLRKQPLRAEWGSMHCHMCPPPSGHGVLVVSPPRFLPLLVVNALVPPQNAERLKPESRGSWSHSRVVNVFHTKGGTEPRIARGRIETLASVAQRLAMASRWSSQSGALKGREEGVAGGEVVRSGMCTFEGSSVQMKAGALPRMGVSHREWEEKLRPSGTGYLDVLSSILQPEKRSGGQVVGKQRRGVGKRWWSVVVGKRRQVSVGSGVWWPAGCRSRSNRAVVTKWRCGLGSEWRVARRRLGETQWTTEAQASGCCETAKGKR